MAYQYMTKIFHDPTCLMYGPLAIVGADPETSREKI